MTTQVLASRTVAGVTIEAVLGDITDLPVDAITNAANDHLWMGSGVAGAIKARGGPAIEGEAMAKGPITVGSAVATTAGDLAARHVIHAAVMGPDLRTDVATVAVTTASVLLLAEEMSLASVAMPLLGTGVGGLDVDTVAVIMVDQVVTRARDGGCADMRVLLVGYDDRAAEAVVRALEGL